MMKHVQKCGEWPGLVVDTGLLDDELAIVRRQYTRGADQSEKSDRHDRRFRILVRGHAGREIVYLAGGKAQVAMNREPDDLCIRRSVVPDRSMIVRPGVQQSNRLEELERIRFVPEPLQPY